MKSLTISEGFKLALRERKVERAFFSTYCVDPDFFELDVLPLLLGDPALSTDETVRYHQLQSLMSDSCGRFALAYDFDVFDPRYTTRLEVDYIPIRVDGACQHAKLAVIEVSDVSGDTALILAAGSFNLTRAGWWTNIEVGHWVELSSTYAPRNIVRPLVAALQYYNQYRAVPALGALQATVEQWRVGPDDPGCTFYFSGAGIERQSFPSALESVNRQSLEIVSPYFSEEGDHPKVLAFLKLFGRPSLLLPTDESGAAAMPEAVYQKLSEYVNWKDWRDEMRTSFALPADRSGFRKLHAKIYAGQGWYFVGSVNLSYKALHENVEAGFLLRSTLKPCLLGRGVAAQGFSSTDLAEAKTVDAAASMPPIHLCYDWHSAGLEAISPETGVLTLFDAQGDRHGGYGLTADMLTTPSIGWLPQHLKQSAFVTATWTRPDGAQSAQRSILVSQRNVYCRPSSLPELEVRDLLRIFQNMHPEARMEVITELAVRQIRLSQDSAAFNEFLPPLPVDDGRGSFFSEFSEVNGAFWNLRKKLAAAQIAGKQHELAYYLSGQQPDSLPSLVRSLSVVEPASQLPLIVRYLTLLNLVELLSLYADASADLGEQVKQLLALAERDPQFGELPPGYLDWIKTAFISPVRQVVTATANQESQIG